MEQYRAHQFVVFKTACLDLEKPSLRNSIRLDLMALTRGLKDLQLCPVSRCIKLSWATLPNALFALRVYTGPLRHRDLKP